VEQAIVFVACFASLARQQTTNDDRLSHACLLRRGWNQHGGAGRIPAFFKAPSTALISNRWAKYEASARQ
jgi:hypothetical protein